MVKLVEKSVTREKRGRKLRKYILKMTGNSGPKDIYRFIEGQAFLRSYDSALHPTPRPLPSSLDRKLDRRHTG